MSWNLDILVRYQKLDPEILSNVLLLILIYLCTIHKTKLPLRLSFKQFLHESPLHIQKSNRDFIQSRISSFRNSVPLYGTCVASC